MTTKTLRKPKAAATKKVQPQAVTKKRETFVRLAEGRTAAAVQAIRLIGNLSNTSLYEYNEADLSKILASIRDELTSTEARFEAEMHKKKRAPVTFAL